MNKQTLIMIALVAVLAGIVSASGGIEAVQDDIFEIGVFVPGVVDGSPTYEMMVAGARQAAEEADRPSSVVVIEGGFNQSTWEEGMMSMAATGRYDLIVTSNPSMPEIAATVAQALPDARFLVLDGFLEGNPQIHTVLFNQQEQAFLCGYFAGLVTSSSMEGSNSQGRIGLLAGQEYPIMNEVILPSYRLGLTTVIPDGTVDFRVLGNWYDAGKAQEIVADMAAQGSDIVLTIAGGGNQGTISAARERGIHVVWYDDSGYDQAPDVVAGSSFVRQDVATYEATLAAIQGTLVYGEARVLGVADGAVSFDTEHPAFRDNVPAEIAREMNGLLDRMRQGELTLPMQLR